LEFERVAFRIIIYNLFFTRTKQPMYLKNEISVSGGTVS